jgi:hypothetical protein
MSLVKEEEEERSGDSGETVKAERLKWASGKKRKHRMHVVISGVRWAGTDQAEKEIIFAARPRMRRRGKPPRPASPCRYDCPHHGAIETQACKTKLHNSACLQYSISEMIHDLK